MKLSWSHKLFFRINQQIGTRPWLDRCMVFCAKWLVYLLLAFFVWMSWDAYRNELGLALPFVTMLALFLAYALSYGVALIWRHDRPIREFPMIKELVHPIGMWKSFPSDHTIFVTVLATIVMLARFPWWIISIFVAGGMLVVAGRVYSGVHYPRDIIGGIIIGLLAAILIRFLAV